MDKEPTQVRCEWCQKWFGAIRKARFCCDRHRTSWHRQEEINNNLKVFKALRKALEYCVKQHPELLPVVTEILSKVQVDLVAPQDSEGQASSSS